MNKERIGDIGQWFSGLMVLAAIIMEFIFQANIWLFVMTIGSFAWGVSTKIKGH